MRFKYIFSLLFFITVVFSAKAQDPIFSHSSYILETLNPGFSGFEDDDRIYAGVLSRIQWPNLDLKLTTQHAFLNKSFDFSPSLGFGVGINATWQYENFNNYSYYQVNANYAQRVNLNRGWFFRPGVEVGVGNRSNNFRNLTLGDQINMSAGTISPVSMDPLMYRIKSPFFADFSVGFVFEKQEYSGSTYWFGVSVKHLSRPNVSFTEGEVTPLHMFYSIHGNYRFPFLYQYSLLLTANYMQQGKYNRLDVGPLFQYNQFLVGVTAATNPARNAQNSHLVTSINTFFGLEWSDLRFGFSYDINTSRIGRTFGVYEFSLTYLTGCKTCNINRLRKR